MKNKLTAIAVKNAPPDGRLQDGGGLILVRRGGAGRWIYRYSFLGRRRDMGIGPQDKVSLAEARKRRDQWARVLADGQDPIEVRNAAREETRAQRDKSDPTLADMIQTVFDARKATLRGDGRRGQWPNPLNNHLIPAIGKLRMSQITPADIKGALAPIWHDKHPTARKIIFRTRIVFRDARLAGVDCDPFTVDAAVHLLGAVRHETRHIPAVRWQDMPALYAEILARGETSSALALRWAILTVTRSMAVRGARFAEIDVNEAIWTVHADRVKGRADSVTDFRVPLSHEALRVAELARQYSTDLLFPGNRGTAISDVAVTKVLRQMPFGGSLHGFRSTFRTWVQDNDACAWDVAETVLGHRIGNRVERTYARSDLLEPRRIAMEAWAAFVTGAGANVARIPRAGAVAKKSRL